ncbi:isocitrate lyase/PEP mutase family protein [Kibdelosporangium phytohabitans]|uniref:3-methyl-2-oxobutanoate hydroxymethyltransferase n=1 Tax=Kibdelosporangium phytohabitans TaxID=860235 RepID=A0A0N7F341_9PSEU|nr:isocitrate lyase/phosphoenolpyruvate mutase family protein [Kibdelosporangium phytohabitans]ALG07575.1 3-methyl-2-oxobutanoate hydroxymethyltransferase [Kibdelosporangium phytohabitans]MBE1471483.1 2-methylisocitrate lyase-like PEP mutase family enzyme [Kibdelosporangium phytohabitans]
MYQEFRALHVPGKPLVLANAWDAGSARLIEAAGVAAVATTSTGIAWSLGLPDGENLARADMLEVVRRIVRAVDLPVTADIESGYADSLDGVAQTVTEFRDAGVVGINFEDAWHGGPQTLRAIADQAVRISAVRKAAGADLFVNARIDTYLLSTGDLADTITRAVAYLDAGADGVFVPGLTDVDVIKGLVAEIGGPVNVMAGPGAPTIAEFAAAGAARVSLGANLAAAAYGSARRAAAEAVTAGTYEWVIEASDFGLLQR